MIRIIKEIVIILLLLAAGLLIEKMTAFPSSLISMILFTLLLLTGVIKEESFSGGFSDLILKNLSFFFISPAVRVIDSLDLLQDVWVKLLLIMIISNILVMGVTGTVVQMILNKGEKHA